MFACWFICLPGCRALSCPHDCQHACLFACRFMCLSACFHACLPTCHLDCMLACLLVVSLTVCITASLSVYLPAFLFVCLPACLFPDLLACLLAYLCLSVCLPVCSLSSISLFASLLSLPLIRQLPVLHLPFFFFLLHPCLPTSYQYTSSPFLSLIFPHPFSLVFYSPSSASPATDPPPYIQCISRKTK